MTFGGYKQYFMLLVGQNTNGSKEKPTEKHLFATDASKVSERRTSCVHRPSSCWFETVSLDLFCVN